MTKADHIHSRVNQCCFVKLNGQMLPSPIQNFSNFYKHLPDLDIIHVKCLLHNIINVSSADKMAIENSAKV